MTYKFEFYLFAVKIKQTTWNKTDLKREENELQMVYSLPLSINTYLYIYIGLYIAYIQYIDYCIYIGLLCII